LTCASAIYLVTPAKAGVQLECKSMKLDSGFRRNDDDNKHRHARADPAHLPLARE
jgi:hypothetical protein